MQIATGLSGARSVQFQGRIFKLMFCVSGEGATVQEFLTKVNDSKISIEANHAPTYGIKNIINKLPLNVALEIAAATEGSVRIESTGTSRKLYGTIELSYDGAVVTKEQEFYVLNVVLDTGLTLDVYQLDSSINAKTKFIYEKAKIFADVPTAIDTLGCKFLAVPKDLVRSLEFKYKDGQNIKMLPVEMSQVMTEVNPVCYDIDGNIIAGSKDLYIWNVTQMNAVLVDIEQDDFVYKLMDLVI